MWLTCIGIDIDAFGIFLRWAIQVTVRKLSLEGLEACGGVIPGKEIRDLRQLLLSSLMTCTCSFRGLTRFSLHDNTLHSELHAPFRE